MKRRTAILLSGALLCSMGGYVAWCLRPFYVPPPLKIRGEVSPGGRREAERWVRYSTHAFRLEFRWDTAWRNLSHPWDCEMATPVEVEEQPDKGLWVIRDSLLWGFSKTRGEWDVSTAHYHGYSSGYSDDPVYRQGAIASRIDELLADGAKLEVLSLGHYTKLGAVLHHAGKAPDGSRNSAITFYDREVLGRIIVVDPQVRERLLEELARSIREAAVYDQALQEPPSSPGAITFVPGGLRRPHLPPATGVVARYGVILTVGNCRAEYLIGFDDGEGEAFDDGIAGIGGPAGSRGEANVGYFRISARAKEAIDGVLDRHGIGRSAPGSEGME